MTLGTYKVSLVLIFCFSKVLYLLILVCLRLLARVVRSNRRHSTGAGFEPPPGRISPPVGKKTLAVLLIAWAVQSAWPGLASRFPGPVGNGPGPSNGSGKWHQTQGQKEPGFGGFSACVRRPPSYKNARGAASPSQVEFSYSRLTMHITHLIQWFSLDLTKLN